VLLVPNDDLRDAALIASAQKIEHYEIAAGFAHDPYSFGIGRIWFKLPARQRCEIGPLPVGVDQKRMSRSQCGQAAIQLFVELLVRIAEALRLMRNRLNDRQRISYAVRQFAKQQFLLRLPGVAFGYITCAFQGELSSGDRFKGDAAFDRQFPTVFGLVLQFALPAAFIAQFGPQLRERPFGYDRDSSFFFFPTASSRLYPLSSSLPRFHSRIVPSKSQIKMGSRERSTSCLSCRSLRSL
jgi:hypothetical protein